jgi:hypothetical protein
MMDMLVEEARHAIIPVSCAIAASDWKIRIMSKHTLDAVMTMPNELFYGVGTNTCIMVFTAGIPTKSPTRRHGSDNGRTTLL